MPKIQLNDASIHYEIHGDGHETILFSHGFLWSGRMFDKQVAALKDRYRCITYDHRGQGQSAVVKAGYDIDNLTSDAVALIEALNCAPCHFAGLSMGGFVGLRLAARRPELLKSLIILESSAEPEPEENVGRYRLLGMVGRLFGLGPVAGQVMPIMFGQKFLNDPDREEERALWRKRLVDNDRVGVFRSLQGVISRAGVVDELANIPLPTLIVVGDQDVATVPAKAEKMHAAIPNSKLVVIPGAGHTSTVEEPDAVNLAIESFLGNLS